MNTKTIIAALVGAISAFLLGWVVWGMLLTTYFQENTYQYEGMMLAETEFKIWAIFLANLANAFLVAWLFTRMNITSFASGFQTGAIINMLISFGMAMMFYSMMNWYKGPAVMIVEIVVNGVFGGIIGGIIALMLGRGISRA